MMTILLILILIRKKIKAKMEVLISKRTKNGAKSIQTQNLKRINKKRVNLTWKKGKTKVNRAASDLSKNAAATII